MKWHRAGQAVTMLAGGKRRGRPRGKATKAQASAAQDAPPVRQTRGRGRGRGRGKGRGKGQGQTRPASPAVDEVSAGSSDSEEDKLQQALNESQAITSRRQLRQRSGSVQYGEGPSQQEGIAVLADDDDDDDSVEWEAPAPDV